jgi:hypothetical protein
MLNQLSSLPFDLVAQIAVYAEGHDLVKLLLCGNRRFNDLLTRFGGVRNLNFVNRQFSAPLPLAVHHFQHVRSLVIISERQEVENFDASRMESIRLLNLESLSLRGSSAYHLFWLREKDTWMPLTPIFPNLKSLSYRDGKWSWHWVDSMPVGLTSLFIRTYHSDCKNAKTFPRSLTSLVTEGSLTLTGAMPALLNARSSLTELKNVGIHPIALTGFTRLIHLATASNNMCNYLENCLSMSKMPLISLVLQTQVNALPKFSPFLTSLDLSFSAALTVRSNLVTMLPRQLTRLSIVASHFKEIDSSFFSVLPTALLELHMDIGDAHDLNSSSILGRLALTYERNIQADRALLEAFLESSCPPSLTKLYFPGLDLIDDFSLSQLPKSIQQLDLWFNPNSRVYWDPQFDRHGLIGEGLLHLPTSLTILCIPTYRGKLRVPEAKALPRTLTRLQIRPPTWLNPRALAQFPPHLRWLELLRYAVISERHIMHLPRSLTHLSFKMERNLRTSTFSQLPANITSLQLKNWRERCNEDILHIPRHITKLGIAGATKLTKDAVSFLPQNLRQLWLNKCSDWDVETSTRLPKTLEVIVARQCFTWTQETVSRMWNLRWLEISAPRYAIHMLPRFIYLNTKNDMYYSYVSPSDELLDPYH